VILARLACEKLILELFGRILFANAEVRNDKILGRKELLAYCRANLR
jgi:hypothetical protein